MTVRKYQTGSLTLQPPRMTPEGLEVSLHTCPRALARELNHVFPGVELGACLAMPTTQKARLDLVGMGDHVETEKDRLLNSFVTFASVLCKEIREAGYWADYIDPCSGLPMLTHGNKVYSEVDGMQLLLQYRVMNAGRCKVLLHPQWGSSVYPASLFCNAPVDVVKKLLEGRLVAAASSSPAQDEAKSSETKTSEPGLANGTKSQNPVTQQRQPPHSIGKQQLIAEQMSEQKV